MCKRIFNTCNYNFVTFCEVTKTIFFAEILYSFFRQKYNYTGTYNKKLYDAVWYINCPVVLTQKP